MKFIVTTHYSEDDTDFGGDYLSIDINLDDGTPIASYGDCYHDKGEEKADAFIDGVKWAVRNSEQVTRENRCVADGVYW